MKRTLNTLTAVLLITSLHSQAADAQFGGIKLPKPPSGISVSKPFGNTGINVPPVNQMFRPGGGSTSQPKSGGGANMSSPRNIQAPTIAPNQTFNQNTPNRPISPGAFNQPNPSMYRPPTTPAFNSNNNLSMFATGIDNLIRSAANNSQQQQRFQQQQRQQPQQNFYQQPTQQYRPSNSFQQQQQYSNNNQYSNGNQYSTNNQYYSGNQYSSGNQYYPATQYSNSSPQPARTTYSNSPASSYTYSTAQPTYSSVPQNIIYTTQSSTIPNGSIDATVYREPSVAPKRYSNLPIKLVVGKTESGICDYTLTGNSKSYNYSMEPGYSQTITEDRSWKVRYFSEGELVEFDLKGGQVYEFVREENTWKLYKQE